MAEQIAALFAQLDSDQFMQRQLAERELLALGPAIYPQLRRAQENGSPEVRFRARRIFEALHHEQLHAGFSELARASEAEFNLEQGMWLVACLLDPELPREQMERRLDSLAEEVAAELKREAGDDFARRASPERVLAALRQVLHARHRFRGNREEYDLPENSSIWRVLETRKGLPLTLAHVAVAVGERLDLPLVGLSIPGRYMFMYQGSRAPNGDARDDLVVDPFGDWEIVAHEQIAERAPGFDPERHLTPSPPRLTLLRMLNNLEADLRVTRRSPLADRVLEYRRLLEAAAPPAR